MGAVLSLVGVALASVVGGAWATFVGGAGEELGRSLYSHVKNALKFPSNHASLQTELANLTTKRKSVKAQLEQAENEDGGQGRYRYSNEVEVWLKEAEDLDKEVNSRLGTIGGSGNVFQYCRLWVTRGMEVANYLTQVKQLIGKFPSGGLLVETSQPRRVEHIQGTSIDNQSTASKNLSKILDLLNDDNVGRIGVWGMGGVGKTTLVKNLNNMFKNSSSTTTRHFSIVIWVTVSRDFDPTRVQTQIAERLKLEVSKNESVERMASKLYESLKKRRFVLILDDVWKSIDLTCLGIPLPEQHNWCKVILTSRSLDVCRRMETDENVKVDILNDEESWKLFASKAGEVATLTHIEPLAKEITRECEGLPLAIVTVGASMREKTLPALWENALNTLRTPTTHNPFIEIEDKVYKPLKWSYDSLPEREGMNVKSCFLYCCLYPESFRIEVRELARCWLAEGFIDELEENYEATYKRGIALVEYLKDSCLLEEDHEFYDGVKMHDVVRKVAIQIACSLEGEHGFYVPSEIGLDHIPLLKLSKSHKRVSFMLNRIRSLPDCAIPFPHVSSLLLQSNRSLENVAKGFFLGFPALKFLNLSDTNIQTLPLTLLKCSELESLFLDHCFRLVEIPSLRGLINLKMINLSRTMIKELPEGMETLTNLRQLFLIGTKSLNKIRAGMISQLYSLDILDMTGSGYQWAARVGEGESEGEASFEELGFLTQLSVLNIHLDVSFLSIHPPSWLSKLKNFHFYVGIDARDGKFNERRATFRSKYFNDTWSLGPSMNLYRCEGFEQKPKKFCFNNLISLTIECTHLFKGENKGNHVASRKDLLPNLQELSLYQVKGINNISDLAAHFGLRLKKLRVIDVEFCHDLKYVFFVGGSGLNLESLEEVRVRDCANVVDLFRCENSSQTSTLVDTFALNLKIVKLEDLRGLETLSQHVSWQRLERLEVINCELLKKLPFTAQIANTIKEIRGESQWWDQLEWGDEDTKSILQQYFKEVRGESQWWDQLDEDTKSVLLQYIKEIIGESEEEEE